MRMGEFYALLFLNLYNNRTHSLPKYIFLQTTTISPILCFCFYFNIKLFISKFIFKKNQFGMKLIE